jgi:hypothetical protein
MKIFSVFLFLLFLNAIDCAKILAIFTVPSKSHSILGYELFKALAAEGHEVSQLSVQILAQ